MWRIWLSAALSLTLLTAPAAAGPAARGAATPVARAAYLKRGDEVESRYQTYRRQLERFFEALDARLGRDAPDLRTALAPPAPVPYGYQILPRLVPNPPRPTGPRRIVSGSYSWSRTDGYIDRDRARLEMVEARLEEATRLAGEARRREHEKLVDEYQRLVAGQRLIANNIEYNRLWQSEIVKHRDLYDRFTILHDAVLERQTLLDASPLGDELLDAGLRARVDELSRRIEEAFRKHPTSNFVRVDHPSPHRWIVRLPVYTDIEDSAFLDRFRAGVEEAWRLRDGDDEFSLVLDIHRLSPADLYPDGGVPAQGAHIDLVDHTRRFPPGGAVLVTGGNTTHVRGYNVILGPHDIAPNVLAHEIGHILGFVDRYFRGYRDRGPDGYEVLEVVIDVDDIMSAPGQGRPRRQHYEQILGEKLR